MESIEWTGRARAAKENAIQTDKKLPNFDTWGQGLKERVLM